MWSHHNKNWILVMVLPTSFAGTKKGFNSYVKALGFVPNSDEATLYCMTFAQFVSLDRSSIDDKISEAGEWCEKMYNNFLSAEVESEKSFYKARWDFFSKKFTSLVREKYSLGV